MDNLESDQNGNDSASQAYASGRIAPGNFSTASTPAYLGFIYFFQKGDPHKTPHQFPLDAVSTWEKLEVLLRGIVMTKEGDIVVQWDDTDFIVARQLWPFYVKNGATFQFSCQPLMTLSVHAVGDLPAPGDIRGIATNTSIFHLRRMLHTLDMGWEGPTAVEDVHLLVKATREAMTDDKRLSAYMAPRARRLSVLIVNAETATVEEEHRDPAAAAQTTSCAACQGGRLGRYVMFQPNFGQDGPALTNAAAAGATADPLEELARAVVVLVAVAALIRKIDQGDEHAPAPAEESESLGWERQAAGAFRRGFL